MKKIILCLALLSITLYQSQNISDLSKGPVKSHYYPHGQNIPKTPADPVAYEKEAQKSHVNVDSLKAKVEKIADNTPGKEKEMEQDAYLNLGTASKLPVLKGCEDYQEHAVNLNYCMNEKFRELFRNYLMNDLNMPESYPRSKILIEFAVAKDNSIKILNVKNLENAPPYFTDSIKKELEKINENNEGFVVYPALNSEGEAEDFRYTIPFTFENNLQ